MTRFTPALFAFLAELAANNNREWFRANKSRYDGDVKEPALAFISDFAPHLARISTRFRADPRANGGSLFRIYRDTRFSKDKRPYKTHTGIHFRHEAAKDAHAPGFYLHLQPGERLCRASGIWRPGGPTLYAAFARPSTRTPTRGCGPRGTNASAPPSSSPGTR